MNDIQGFKKWMPEMCVVYFDQPMGALQWFAGQNHLFQNFNTFFHHKLKKEEYSIDRFKMTDYNTDLHVAYIDVI